MVTRTGPIARQRQPSSWLVTGVLIVPWDTVADDFAEQGKGAGEEGALADVVSGV